VSSILSSLPDFYFQNKLTNDSSSTRSKAMQRIEKDVERPIRNKSGEPL